MLNTRLCISNDHPTHLKQMQRKLLAAVFGALLYTLPLYAQVPNGVVLERLKTLEDAIRSLEGQIALLTGSLRAPTAPPAVADMPGIGIPSMGSHVKGASAAKVAIIEFSDFECPFCGRHAAGVYRQLQAQFVNTGRVSYQFRHLPLEQIHPNAKKASEAAECAGDQEKFWEFHDALFANQKALMIADLGRHAGSVGLDVSRFESCLSEGKMAAKVAADIAEAQRLDLTGTPAFLIGEIRKDGAVIGMRKIIGAQPYAVFETVLNELLAKQ